jgi:hypothetical protein
MQEWGRAHACKVASHYSLPCKLTHNWSPSIWFCLYRVICPVIDNPASCKIHAATCFLHTTNMGALEIHQQLCADYGQNVMTEGTVRQCCRMFKDGRISIHAEEQSGRPYSEWWSYSKCWPKKLWKTEFHDFRTFMWISTNFMHCSQLGYVITSLAQNGFHKCLHVLTKCRQWLWLWFF